MKTAKSPVVLAAAARVAVLAASMGLAGCNVFLGIEELPLGAGGAGGVGATGTDASTTVDGTATASSSSGCDANACGPTCAVKCNGDPCDGSGECQSGHCADGVCCTDDCQGLCQACDVFGTKGACTDVPAAKPDPSCVALGQPPVACDGAGACKAAPGSPCAAASDCSAGVCLFGLCKYALNTACEADLDCATGFCKGGFCSQCNLSANDCATTQCVVAGSQNVCLIPPGGYCVANTQCNSMNCNPSSQVCL